MDRTRTSSTTTTSVTGTPTTTNTTVNSSGVGGVVTTTNGSCNDNDIVVVVNNNYICRLCNYKTNLKANFQLHSKTDKHLQKLNLLNHIKEGGIMNEYKLIKFQQQQHQLPTNLIHIKCNCCDFYTNSMQKLTLHVQNMRHDAMAIVQQHLIYLLQQQQQLEDDSSDNKPNNDKSDNKNENIDKSLDEDEDDDKEESVGAGRDEGVEDKKKAIVKKNKLKKLLYCQLCNYIAIHLLDMLQHVNCLQHLQMEQFVCLQRRCDNLDTPTLHDIFKLCDDHQHHQQQPQHSQTPDATKPTSMTPTETTNKIAEESAIPTVIYKCNNCEHYTQTKEEMLSHVEAHHANSEQDFISIPTNEAALQAFQAAVVMATAAAAAAAAAVNTEMPATSTTAPTTTPVHIKKEPREDEECVEDRELGAAYMNCPLCNDSFLDKSQLEQHLMQVHSVNSDGLERLLLLVEQQMWRNVDRKCMAEEEKGVEKVLNLTKTAQPTTPTTTTSSISNNTLNCSQCSASFKHKQQLLQHAQQMEHFAQQSNGEYACLAANLNTRPCQQLFSTLAAMYAHYKHEHLGVVISERHVYKYRCKQCSLAFKTPERLATHSLYHMMRDATKCAICQRNFRSTQALQKHVEQAHAQTQEQQQSQQQQQQVSPNIRLISPDLEQMEAKLESESKSMTPDLKQQQHMSSKSSQHDSEVSEPKQQLNESRDALTPTATTSALSYEMLQRFFMQQQQQQQQQQQPHLPPHIQNLGPALLGNPDMPPFNPVDMINMMQFHQLMSLNFMNLAPPLIIGNNNNVLETANPQIPLDCLPNINCNTPSSSGTKTPLRSNETPAQFLHQTPNVTSNSNQLSNNHKRARTRITDEQLKILRAHFDINNSPSEESIMEMSQKAKLPMKVVKHWFRNTLFKERQRNKDSPYNFNNPPSTTLNLEEYERTGNAKVTSLTQQQQQHQNNSTLSDDYGTPAKMQKLSDGVTTTTATTGQDIQQQQQKQQHETENAKTLDLSLPTTPKEAIDFTSQNQSQQQPPQQPTGGSVTSSTESVEIKTEVINDDYNEQQAQQQQQQQQQQFQQNVTPFYNQQQQQQHNYHGFFNNYETKSESGSSDVLSRPPTPNSATHFYANLTNELMTPLQQQQQQHHNDNSVTYFKNCGLLQQQQQQQVTESNMGPPKLFQTNNNSGGGSLAGGSGSCGINLSNKSPTGGSASTSATTTSAMNFDNNSNSSNSSSSASTSAVSSGKRANRTRFTDYQIKVLQEFFENNSYPKDSDLEYLSKLLLLSPRVIVVWFQNARQKQRKIYENQPNNNLYESEEAKQKQNINYVCKRCNLVFQRYYELIRHQKNHCFKEENNKKSAKAQIAAAQIAAVTAVQQQQQQHFSCSEDSNSSMDQHQQQQQVVAMAALAAAAKLQQQQHMMNESRSSSSHATTPTTTPPVMMNVEQQQQVQQQFDNNEQQQQQQLLQVFKQQQQQQAPTSPSSATTFNNLLLNLQQAAVVQQQQQQQQQLNKKRKFQEQQQQQQQYEQQQRYEYFLQYFLKNENNLEIKEKFQQKLLQQQQQLEYLENFYQKNELKKEHNFDYLYKYYMQNQQQQQQQQQHDDLNIENLWRYYQLNESQKLQQQITTKTTDDQIQQQQQEEEQQLFNKRFKQANNTDDIQERNNIVDKSEEQIDHHHVENENEATTNLLDRNLDDDENSNLSTPSNPSESLGGSGGYLQNLDEFLDTMLIENHSATPIAAAAATTTTTTPTSLLQANKLNDTTTNKSDALNENKQQQQQQNKRLRTTILPEQLNFLYECYAKESNPSRKMLEEISKEVNLKKRVVQ